MTYYIDEHTGSQLIQTFPEFTDTLTVAGTADCGNRAYTLTAPAAVSGVITLGSPRDLTIATTDMSLVGTYQVTILVSLQTYPENTNAIGLTKTIKIKIDNRCLHTNFIQISPVPLMIHFVGNQYATQATLPVV